MKVLFCGYRKWADNVYEYFDMLDDEDRLTYDIYFANSPESMMKCIERYGPFERIVLLGWSWIVPKDICESSLVVGIHPSDLPEYAGGSPIQHQIIDGLQETQCTLFQITPNLDAGGIYAKKRLDLTGSSLSMILNRLTSISIGLIERFLEDPDPAFMAQGEVVPKKRLKPEDSNITNLFGKVSVEHIYDLIRCRTSHGYPTAYIEDEDGRLEFYGVRYIPHGKDS